MEANYLQPKAPDPSYQYLYQAATLKLVNHLHTIV